MRVVCCQFYPKFKAPAENRAHATSMLAHLERGQVDILLLPEMAFTGYVFKDREEIAPFAEDAQQGDTVCWAKQQATRLSAFVIVGYPEKSFNTSTQKYEFYNSACIVDRHGQLVHTYRKNYLYETDLSWSEWSTDGFVTLTLDGIGRVGIGICMDLNEDTRIGNFFEIPFATYQRRAKPDLILLLMNWLKSPRSDEMIRHSVVKRYRHQVLTTTPKQHVDWCTLDYWISRLSPLWHGDRRVNVAICNRIGVERDTCFAGTSTGLTYDHHGLRIRGCLSSDQEDILILDF